ncbi:MAG TPA: FAD binding domain-containing protein [Candidatus Dormibacteraeota bacterium]|nr:FAD binding domain-containing protein [Candidatus Dormibacteraeota bacterium]
MRPASFDYVRTGSLEEALGALSEPGAVALAGGQTLVNLMRQRVVRPRVVVDISRVSGLDEVRLEDGRLVVGALARLGSLAELDLVRAACPALAQAAAAVGDPQVRNRATIAGNLCHPLPVSDIAPVLLASDGSLLVRSRSGQREVPATEFFAPPLGSGLRPGELIVEVRFGRLDGASAYERLSRRVADPAVAAAAAFVRMVDARVEDVAVALGAVHEVPVLVPSMDAIRGGPFHPEAARAALESFCGRLSPPSSPHAGADYRRRVAVVVALRALARAAGRRS